jgi:hypothetical protein
MDSLHAYPDIDGFEPALLKALRIPRDGDGVKADVPDQ